MSNFPSRFGLTSARSARSTPNTQRTKETTLLNVLDAKSSPYTWPNPLPPMMKSSLLHRIESLYDAGDVKRLHTVPTLRPNTVAEHVYGSLVIATELIRMNRKTAAAQTTSLSYENIVSALLVHDAPEVQTGDAPAPVKRALIEKLQIDIYEEMEAAFYRNIGLEFPELNEVEIDIVKASDILDLGYNCVKERLLGNRHPRLAAVFENVQKYLTERNHLVGVIEMAAHLDDVWKEL